MSGRNEKLSVEVFAVLVLVSIYGRSGHVGQENACCLGACTVIGNCNSMCHTIEFEVEGIWF